MTVSVFVVNKPDVVQFLDERPELRTRNDYEWTETEESSLKDLRSLLQVNFLPTRCLKLN